MKRIMMALLALCLLVSSCNLPATPAASAEFNFIFKYGITARNELDTFKGTFTKDMVIDTPVTTNLSLTAEEKNRIYQKMVEIDFFNYPEKFAVTMPPGGPTGMVTPYSSYYFKVQRGSQVKELSWDDKITNPDEKANKLRGLVRLIQSIIESKEEFKKLPVPKGGYM